MEKAIACDYISSFHLPWHSTNCLFGEEGDLLVLDEVLSHGIILLWCVSGIAVFQNNYKAWISLLHRDTYVQWWAHWQADLAWRISLSVVGITEQRHKGSGFSTCAWNAISWPVNKICFLKIAKSGIFLDLAIVLLFPKVLRISWHWCTGFITKSYRTHHCGLLYMKSLDGNHWHLDGTSATDCYHTGSCCLSCLRLSFTCW